MTETKMIIVLEVYIDFSFIYAFIFSNYFILARSVVATEQIPGSLVQERRVTSAGTLVP